MSFLALHGDCMAIDGIFVVKVCGLGSWDIVFFKNIRGKMLRKCFIIISYDAQM